MAVEMMGVILLLICIFGIKSYVKHLISGGRDKNEKDVKKES